MYDPTESNLDTLEPWTRNAAEWLIWATRTAGYPVIISSARRSKDEQARLVAAGRSRTLSSKHLKGQAFDIDISGMGRDQVPRWFWDLIGPWAETNLGLRWGGRFSSIYDPGHFETP